MTDILPTHTCFDDALDLIDELVKEDLASADRLILVHGIAIATSGRSEGQPYAHAWVEDGDHCWDSGLVDGQRVYFSVHRSEFYPARQIQETTRYTVREALAENWKANHYGPWNPKYVALCARGENHVTGSIQATFRPQESEG